jgi:hypothetical protein
VTTKINEQQIAQKMIKVNFTAPNLVALVVPSGDYEAERAILNELDDMPEVQRTMGLSNIEAMDGYTLTDKLTPRQFAELADIDYELSRLIYTAYATEQDGNGMTYRVHYESKDMGAGMLEWVNGYTRNGYEVSGYWRQKKK